MSARSPLEQFEKIPTSIFNNSSDACAALAQEVAQLIRERDAESRRTVLGLATGSTPVPFYRELIRLHREEGLSFRNVVTFNLDEYYGIPRDHPESYHRFMREQLFDHVDIPGDQINLPDGMVGMDEVFKSCDAYERRIRDAGGIDLQILGIGRTGHIGFNEPGSTRDSRTRLIALDRVTRRDAAADFLGEENVPRFAVTMGVGTILEARRIVLMAWGDNKADIVAEAVEGPVTDSVSASFLQAHGNAAFYIDGPASGSLTRIGLPWLVGNAKWGAEETRRAVIWLAAKCRKPILKLVDEEYNENGMGELLTREGNAYRLNIRIFNQLQHTITGWPGGKPNADDTNRPARAHPFPKRCLVFAPEPEDEILSMAGTIERLVEQGHDVRIVYQTSGSLRVSDAAATKFARILHMLAVSNFGRDELVEEETSPVPNAWAEQEEYARSILDQIEEKGPFGEHTAELRRLKALIRRGEARDACAALGVSAGNIRFLDLPFYEKGRYRRFSLEREDLSAMVNLLNAIQPDQIYATGHLADPSSVQGICFEALQDALRSIKDRDAEWLRSCEVWLYRGHQKELRPHEIAMAVPMSPDQLELKVGAINKFQSHNIAENLQGERNRETAVAYDHLGMAEYEAIEAFERFAL